MMANVIYLEHALCPHRRQVRQVLRGTVRAHDPRWRRPYIAMLDGQPLLRADWDRPLAPGQTLAFIDAQAFPQDGGGKSNPLAVVLSLALVLATPYAVSMLAPELSALALAGDAAAAFGIAAIKAGIGFVGTSLINAMFRESPTKSPSITGLPAASPTYNLGAQGNMARIEGVIPEHFGRHLAYPDFAAQPYVRYMGNEQYLYQLFCIGRGHYDIETIRIEDSAITSFEGVSYQIVAPSGAVRLFPANVVTAVEVSGQDLDGRAATYAQSGTTLTVTLTAHGYTAGGSLYLDATSGTAVDGDYEIDSITDANTFVCTAPGSLTTSGAMNVFPWIGPFAISAASQDANYLEADIVFPRGTYSYDTGTGDLNPLTVGFLIAAREIDGSGTPVGSWVTLEELTYNEATTTPQRLTVRYDVDDARYEMRVRRMTLKPTLSNEAGDIVWAGARAFLPSDTDFGDVTLLAVRMKASNQLSAQSARKINVIATRKLPPWRNNAWRARAATRSPAWAAAYAAQQIGFSDDQIDLDALEALDATCTARGDTFDARFDSAITGWEALTRILRAVRARCYIQGGILRVVRDQAQTMPVALYSTRNIVRGSFGVEYILAHEDMADGVRVAYFDTDVWAPRSVDAILTGSPGVALRKMETFGITQREQAHREGLYEAACNKYRRKLIRFETEMEGFIPSIGDLVAIAHDMPAWGQTAEMVAWDAATLTATLSEPLTWTEGETHYIGLRRRDGSVSGPYEATAADSLYRVVLDSLPDFTPYTAGAEERTHCVFGWGETWRQPALVLSVRPRGMNRVEIECVNEDDSVHTADSGVTMPATETSQLPSRFTAPAVAGLSLMAAPDDPDVMLLSWQPAAGADHYLIEMATADGPWTRTGETHAAHYTCRALYGSATLVRVAAVGLVIGPWVEIAYGDHANYMWNANAGTGMWTSGAALMWN